jgi:hypothetical protein
VWSVAKEITGAGSDATITSLACWAAGNCVIGGTTITASGSYEGFLASEVHDVWGPAQLLTDNSGIVSLLGINQVACSSSGICVAVGDNGSGAYMLTLTNGVVGAQEMITTVTGADPGSATSASAVACPSSGNCVIAGTYSTAGGLGGAFTLGEQGGTWGTPQELPGLVSLNTEGAVTDAAVPLVAALSCGAAGSCVVGGQYNIPGTASVYRQESYLAIEVNGVWSPAAEVPGTAALNANGTSDVTSAACTAVGSCTVVGFYGDAGRHSWSYVTRETNGRWATARRMAFQRGITGFSFSALSCATATTCVADGSINNELGIRAVEKNGVWGAATIYNVAASNHTVYSNRLGAASCVRSGYCVIGGSYDTTEERNGSGGRTIPGRSTSYVESAVI